MNVFFYGPYGIGKTTFIKSVLSKTLKFYGYVDCILHKDENEIAKFLFETIFGLMKFNDPNLKINSFLTLKEYFYKRGSKKRPVYLVFDNITRLFGRKLFKKILSLKYSLRVEIRVILICDGFIPKVKFCSDFLLLEEDFIRVLMPSPSKEHLAVVLSDKLSLSSTEDAFNIFIELIYQQYRQYTVDIHYFLYLCDVMLPVFLKGIDLNNITEQDIPKLYSENFREVGKALINKLYIPLSSMEELDVKAIKYNDTEEVIFFSKKEETQFYGQITRHGLTYLEAVILIAAYIACHNPEQTDQKIFVKQRM